MTNNNLKLGNEETLKHNSKCQNTALGIKSLKASRTGVNNSAVGFKSLKNSMDNSNSSLGSFSGEKLETGNQNILIGSKADVISIESINQIVIGSNSDSHGDNIMVLGNSDIVSIDPLENNKKNLGSKKYQYKNIYLNGNIYKDGNKVNLNDSATITNKAPTSNDNSGNQGDLRYDNDFLYICIGNNQWGKVALTDVTYGSSGSSELEFDMSGPVTTYKITQGYRYLGNTSYELNDLPSINFFEYTNSIEFYISRYNENTQYCVIYLEDNNIIYYIRSSVDGEMDSANHSTTNIDDATLFEILNKDQLPSNFNIDGDIIGSKNPQGLFLKVKDEDFIFKVHSFGRIGLLEDSYFIEGNRTNEWHSYIIPEP